MDHSSRPLPPLDTLQAFEAAARAGSFSAAADTLNLTHGAVSRQIAKLESWLGFKVLFGIGLVLRTILGAAAASVSRSPWAWRRAAENYALLRHLVGAHSPLAARRS